MSKDYVRIYENILINKKHLCLDRIESSSIYYEMNNISDKLPIEAMRLNVFEHFFTELSTKYDHDIEALQQKFVLSNQEFINVIKNLVSELNNVINVTNELKNSLEEKNAIIEEKNVIIIQKDEQIDKLLQKVHASENEIAEMRQTIIWRLTMDFHNRLIDRYMPLGSDRRRNYDKFLQGLSGKANKRRGKENIER